MDGKFETGAYSAEVNDLILVTENTPILIKELEKIYKDFELSLQFTEKDLQIIKERNLVGYTLADKNRDLLSMSLLPFFHRVLQVYPGPMKVTSYGSIKEGNNHKKEFARLLAERYFLFED